MKYFFNLISFFMIIFLLCSCSITTTGEEKIGEPSYKIVEYHYLNKYVKEIYDEKKNDYNRVTYNDGEYCYLIICYGPQPTTGYSIAVKELYETENTIVVDTTLKGPLKSDIIEDKESYPAIVIKIDATDKIVVYK